MQNTTPCKGSSNAANAGCKPGNLNERIGMIDFATATDRQVKGAHAIVRRAQKEGILHGSALDAEMDIIAADMTCPLDLDRFYNGDYIDFAHDFLGIRHSLNRETGNLENCFVPRFAQKG
jgi:hypothetical protein